ncbi:ER membrane protein complex subunit 10 [Culicoides brevitarsis]|uniref:ER membrane protein complex subunit 10 n=1 Tax=Culicoides brevitarsis TaxID=469753 RepID=UPI00307C0FDA
MRFFQFVTVFILVASSKFIGNVKSEFSDLGWLNIQLFHALQGDDFTLRGNITVTNLNTGSLNINQEPLNENEKLALKSLAENNKLYRLKATIVGSDGQKYTYLTSSRACSLVRSQLLDTIWISVDHAGFVLGVSQTIPSSRKGDECGKISASDLDALEEFNTDVYVKHIEVAPVPDTATFIQKMEMERQARERGDLKDNRGFFAKYWMYIVPVAILVLISGVTNPENQQGGGGAR